MKGANNFENPPKSSSKFRQYFSKIQSGDFLLSPKVRALYPYLLMICAMGVIVIVNERSIRNKEREIAAKEREYQITIEEVKNHNIYLDYDEKMKIKQIAIERGFVEKDNHIYKITINSDNRKK